jgi:hypothetical protein
MIRSQNKPEETKRLKKIDIPSLNLDKLKQYSTNEPQKTNKLLAKQEVLSERGKVQDSFSKNAKQDLLYGNYKKGNEGVLSVDKNNRNKKMDFAKTGRMQVRDEGNMYGTSVNRNYQSTGRTISNREGNLELYAHRKNQSKNEFTYQNLSKNQRRGWKDSKNSTELTLLQRYNSIEIQKRNILDNSLPPKEKNKRGLSILNRENNNFVRDVSERVKRAPLTKLKSIGLYQEQNKEDEYQFSGDLPEKKKSKEIISKSGVLKEEKKPSSKKNEGLKTGRSKNKSTNSKYPSNK